MTCEICGTDTTEADGLCCAEKQQNWSCDGCGANLVGFAFPLGACPRCGGTLQATEAGGGPGDDYVAAIRHAIEIEMGGVAFYAEAARRLEDGPIKELFAELAVMEEQHLVSLQKRYHITEELLADDGVGLAQLVVYGDTEVSLDNAEGVLKLAIELERRARDFFVEQRDSLPVGSTGRQLFAEMADEEAEHIQLLRGQQ